ncbi:DeoR/GlpR family DNA-binding transcription regulator [Specibacter cremeus]|uniref:DeoR/GlpR family DNA-binding transcription regulator n=1 Tax=Specibacter cremeus TaxID=1629051 RepID=UPI00197C4A0D|nr:DeoR/GlpR family DNA-binding transcription regulator [Specibacter cremeus]
MITLAAEERLAWLLDRLKTHGSVTLADAAGELEVSQMTIRRDLQDLEGTGDARRVRGGAVWTGATSFTGRERANSDEKNRIAAKLLPYVPATGLVAFDSSTTIYRLATLLTRARGLTVVTNSIQTLEALRGKPGIDGMLTGGVFDENSTSLVGPVATASIRRLSFQSFFCSASAVHETMGCSEGTLEEADVKRAMSESAAQTLLGANIAKFGSRSAAQSVEWPQVSVLATELDPHDDTLAGYRRLVPTVV